MAFVESSSHPSGGAGAGLRSIEIADLAEMSVVDLVDLYRAGTVPDSLRVLDHVAQGRMLAVRGLDWRGARDLYARVTASRFFPWAGKRFQHLDRNEGTGINRLRLAGERLWYPFRTRIEPSALDGAPCIALDYDLPENPRIVRALRDELREVSPGLFLGPALYRAFRKPRLVMFFACDDHPPLTH
jgi:hypothetical protein